MTVRKKIRFRTKLFLLLLFIGLFPVILLGYLNYHYAHKIMDRQAINQLISLREDRKAQLQFFFKHLRLDMEILSDHRLLKDILAKYIAAYNKGGIDGEEFKAVDKRCHKRCVEISKRYGYEDMLFVNPDGDVLITVKKGADWGANLISGIYSDTNLAECFKNAERGMAIVDFKEYPPLGKPAAFIGAPMIRREERRGFKAEEKIGVLIIRIPADQINAIMMRKEGLGDTGETCLIGKDFFMRSDSRFLKGSAILKVKAETSAVRAAFEGRSGHKEHVIDYKGELVSIAYGPAEIEGLDWVITAKKEIKEILKPMRALRNQSLIIALLVAIGVMLADFLFVTGIRKPIKRIREIADKMAAGDLTVRIPVETGGEVGRLAVCLNNMTQNLMESRAEIEEYNRLLEKKVEIRTAALREKTKRLEEGNNTQKSHNEIVTALNTELEIEPLLKSIIGKIAGHTDSQIGVIYLYEKESKTLRPGSTYAVDRELLRDGFRLGHGLSGQSALERRAILVTDVPENYFRISSGGIDGMPKNVICMPITIKDQLVGVLELASIHYYTAKSLKFLNIVAYQLGIGINNALTYLRLEKMAEDLKEKNELLAAQNEELQAQSEELQVQAEELMSQKKDLEEKTKKVIESDRLKSEFLSNMSHELRTPLNALLGLTSLMIGGSAGPINKKQKEYLEIVDRNGKNLLQLINDILDLSRIEAGSVEVSIGKIHLKQFVATIVHATMPLIEEKGLSLNVDVGDDIFTYGDVGKLKQVLVNLIGNAVKFTDKGEIGISAMVEEGKLHEHVIIKVSDTGIGIPAEALKYIFDPFRQVDGSSTRKYDGTGLGLSICQKLVNLMYGKIEVESIVGKGTTFTITLKKDRRSKLRPTEEDWQKRMKAALLRKDEVYEPECRLSIKEQAAGDRETRKILIIDDDPIVIRELKIIFKEENYHVTFALGGSEGLDRIMSNDFDLILLDLKMPDMDGYKVLEELQKSDVMKNLPVMIITAADLTEAEKRDLDKNVKGVITKGRIDKSDLLGMIDEILGSRVDTERKAYSLRQNVSAKSPVKILIAEDRRDDMILIKETLRSTGYTVYNATNGQEAIDIAEKEKPDLILMDMQMPVMSGFQATRQIRKTHDLKNIPIIALTARAMKGDEEKVLAAGCSDYLSKPVMPKDLLGKIKQWLRY